MAEPNFSWIYIIIFLAIPLARILPRILAKAGIGKNFSQSLQPKESESYFDEYSQKPPMESSQKPPMESSQPISKNELVLAALNKGSKSFESIQKNTGLNNQELDAVLEDLEKNDMLKVVQKQGMLGPKTELYPTDKGFREYHSF